MAKDTYYFSHDYNARNDEKILELRSNFGAEGYGVFWMVVETMAENDNGGAKVSLIGGLSLGYGVPKEKLLAIINYCIEIELFFEDDGYIFSRRMRKHKDFRTELSKKGKEGAEKRWKNSPPNSPPNAKESKVKERKGKENNINKGFNTKPLASDFNGLPDHYKIISIELIKRTKQIDINSETVISMWEIFKIQKLTGQEYHANEGKVYSYFVDWIKFQNFSKDNTNGKSGVTNNQSGITKFNAGAHKILAKGKAAYAAAGGTPNDRT